MISFYPTDEQQQLIDTLHRYAESDLRKVAHDVDESGEAPAPLINKGWELGLLPGLIPESYGGFGGDQLVVTGALALEELAWGDLGIGHKMWAPATFALAVLISGSEQQKQALLPAFCDVDRPLKVAALSEPSVLFNPWKPVTTASLAGEKVTLNGIKARVPLAADAESFIVYAANTETGKVDGYIVKRDAAGLTVGEREKLLGIHALPTYPLTLANVEISLSDRLGGEAGTNYAAILNRGRIALGAMAVGVMRASFEYAVEYAKTRVQFGAPIATKQAVAFNLAEVAIEIDAARMLVWEAAWQADQGAELTPIAARLKTYIDKAAMLVTDTGVQVLGGYGYIREYPAERWLRNARGFASFDGLALV